jgi:hypothetical protein
MATGYIGTQREPVLRRIQLHPAAVAMLISLPILTTARTGAVIDINLDAA